MEDRLSEFDTSVKERLNDENHMIPGDEDGTNFGIRDVDIEDEDIEPLDANWTAEEADAYTPDAYDKYIGARLLIPKNGERVYARVTKRKKDENGRPIGQRHENPMLDTRQYEVELPDGSTDEYFANTIAENIYAVRRMDLKESNPVEVAEYAVANKIEEEPAFKWWVPYVLKKRNRILSKVKSKYWRTTHKFGIELPHSVEEAYEIDKKTGTLHWTKAIEKEMKKINSLQAFEKVEGITPDGLRKDATKLPGHAEVGLHMIFDVKMDGNFTRKARLVANGNETPTIPKYDRYASVVSRES
eukprot:scaffold6944_cov68-Cylindrotheca_fusiformis.AAC.1